MGGQCFGAFVEFGVAQFHPPSTGFGTQGDRLRGGFDLSGEPGMQRRITGGQCRDRGITDQRGTLGGTDRIQIAHVGGIGIGESGQQIGQMVEHAGDRRIGEALGGVLQPQQHLVVAVSHQRQWEVGLAGVVEVSSGHLQAGVEALVVVDDHALEKGCAGRDSAPGLHGRQRGVFVGAQRDLLGAQRAQPRHDLGVVVDLDAHRQGVDEQADDRLDAGHIGDASGAGRTEHDVGLAAVAVQQHRPSGLHHGVHRDLRAAGRLGNLLGQLRREAPLTGIEGLIIGPAGSQCVDPERGRSTERAQFCAPERLSGSQIQRSTPLDVVAIRTRRRQFQCLTRTRGVIQPEPLLQHNEGAPVEQCVVKRPQHTRPPTRKPGHEQPHHRSARQIEVPTAISTHHRVESPLGLLGP